MILSFLQMEEAEPPESEDEEQFTQRPDASMKKKVSTYSNLFLHTYSPQLMQNAIAYSSICKSFISVLGWLMPERFCCCC
jgi:hypothetical protein